MLPTYSSQPREPTHRSPAAQADGRNAQKGQNNSGESDVVEEIVTKKKIADDFYRDMHIVVLQEKRTYRVPKGSPAVPGFINIVQVTKSHYVPRGDQKPTEDMLSGQGPAVAILWANYRARCEAEVVDWCETLRYEGEDMGETELLASAYSDIKEKRTVVDSVFDALGAY